MDGLDNMGLETLKAQVESCLGEYPSTLNSDTKLANAVIYKFYGSYLKKDEEGDLILKLKDRYFLPSDRSIARIRQAFNANGKYLPTDPEIIRKRGEKEETWYHHLGY